MVLLEVDAMIHTPPLHGPSLSTLEYSVVSHISCSGGGSFSLYDRSNEDFSFKLSLYSATGATQKRVFQLIMDYDTSRTNNLSFQLLDDRFKLRHLARPTQGFSLHASVAWLFSPGHYSPNSDLGPWDNWPCVIFARSPRTHLVVLLLPRHPCHPFDTSFQVIRYRLTFARMLQPQVGFTCHVTRGINLITLRDGPSPGHMSFIRFHTRV